MADSGILLGTSVEAAGALEARGWRYLAPEWRADDGSGRWWCASCEGKPMTVPKRGERTR